MTFFPHLSGAMASVGGGLVYVGADVSHAAPDAGNGTTTPDWTSRSSSGPFTVIIVGWYDAGADRVLSSCNVGTLVATSTNDRRVGIGIVFLDRALNNETVTMTFDGNTEDSSLTILSFSGVTGGESALDQDGDYGFSDTATDLNALTTGNVNGAWVAAVSVFDNSVSISWDAGTEVHDANEGSWKFSVVYGFGVPSDPTASWSGGNRQGSAGASFR